ncbi:MULTISPECIES: AraC family transcriptional regulator [unclassified Streptomyces]|uniref:helix-turn-helix domain-containing protein n=1 Tax=unclassified Streptomyces TaxID=2593676 RepID=UPI00339EF063
MTVGAAASDGPCSSYRPGGCPAGGPERHGSRRACGFTSPSHFARRFRETFGCTPVQWRQRPCGHP